MVAHGWNDHNRVSCNQVGLDYCGLSGGTAPADSFVSSGRQMFVRWRAGFTLPTGGFSASWSMVPTHGSAAAQVARPLMDEFEATLFRNGSMQFDYLEVHDLANTSAWSGITNSLDIDPMDMTSAVVQGAATIHVTQIDSIRSDGGTTSNGPMTTGPSLASSSDDDCGGVPEAQTHRICVGPAAEHLLVSHTAWRTGAVVRACSGYIIQPNVHLNEEEGCAIHADRRPTRHNLRFAIQLLV